MKKDKEIVFELESQVREISNQFSEQLRSLDTRLDTHLGLVYELIEYYRKQSEAEAEYSKMLEKLLKQITMRHKDNKQKRESWIGYSTFNAWQGILACTKEMGKDHSALSDVINNHVVYRLSDVSEDMQRIHKKCKDMIIACQEDIKKVLNELVKSMKTYHVYHGESKVAESKLLRAQSQREKSDQQNVLMKFVNYEKKSEKKKAKYTENKLKALRARNDYLLNIDTANVAISKYFRDFPRMVQKMDTGFQNMASRVLDYHVTSHKIMLRKDMARADVLYQGALGIQGPNDFHHFKNQWCRVFNQPPTILFQPHKDDGVSQLSAQKLVQEEMLMRMDQVKCRINRIKEERDEMSRKINQGEELFFERLKGQPINVEIYFNDYLSVKSPTDKNKDVAIKNEDCLFELYKDNLLKDNLVHRLEAKHELLRKALGEGGDVDCGLLFFRPPSLPPKPKKKSKNSKNLPILFGGDVEEYVKATGEDIPTVMKSCIHVINQFGMHHQGIFRVSGSVSEMGNYKSQFEKGEDPLQDKIDGDDINTVAGLLKLYFRELKQPLFTFPLYDALIKCSQTVYAATALSSTPSALTSTSVPASSSGGGEACDWKAMLSRILSTLSHERITIMRFLFAFLNHVTEYSDENMMEAFNLSICFGPTLMYAPPERTDQHQFQNYVNDLIKNIIVHYEELFPPPTQEDYVNKVVYEKYMDDKDYLDSMSDDDGLKDHMNEEDDEIDKHEAVVNDDYTGQSEKELSVSRGDIVQLLFREDDHWLVDGDGRKGLLPDRVLTYGKGGTLFRYTKATRDKSSEYLNQSNSSIPQSSSHSNLLKQPDGSSVNQSRISSDSANQVPSNKSPSNDSSSPWQPQPLLVPVLPPLPRLSFRTRLHSASPTHLHSPIRHHHSPTSELDIQVSPPSSSLDIHQSSSPKQPSSPKSSFHLKGKDDTLSLGRASFNLKLLSGHAPTEASSKWRSLPHGTTPPKTPNQPASRSSHQSSPAATAVLSAAFNAPPTNSAATVVKTSLGSSVSLNSNLFRHQQLPKQQSTTATTTSATTTATTITAATLPRINEKFSAPPAIKTKPVFRKRVSAEGILSNAASHSPLTISATTTAATTTAATTTRTTATTRVVDDAPSVKPSKIFQNIQQQKQLLLQQKQQNKQQPQQQQHPQQSKQHPQQPKQQQNPQQPQPNQQQPKQQHPQQPQPNQQQPNQQQPNQQQPNQQQHPQQPKKQASMDLTPGSTFSYKKPTNNTAANNNNTNNNNTNNNNTNNNTNNSSNNTNNNSSNNTNNNTNNNSSNNTNNNNTNNSSNITNNNTNNSNNNTNNTNNNSNSSNNNNNSNTFKTIDNINTNNNEGFSNSERNQFSSFKITSKK